MIHLCRTDAVLTLAIDNTPASALHADVRAALTAAIPGAAPETAIARIVTGVGHLFSVGTDIAMRLRLAASHQWLDALGVQDRAGGDRCGAGPPYLTPAGWMHRGPLAHDLAKRGGRFE